MLKILSRMVGTNVVRRAIKATVWIRVLWDVME